MKPGFGPEICAWYTNQSYILPNDTSLWYGGDFLPPTYTAAAQCACEGDGNPLWNTNAASCVRTFLVNTHKQLSGWIFRSFFNLIKTEQTKLQLREATLSNNPIEWTEWAATFEQIHINAYATCGCPGKPAPYPDWLGIVLGGSFLPCPTVIDAILQFGRCGCGW